MPISIALLRPCDRASLHLTQVDDGRKFSIVRPNAGQLWGDELSGLSWWRETSGCGTKETVQVAFRAASRPHLAVHALEACAAHHAHCDLVGKLFGLEIGMMCEHPQMSELMCNRRLELIILSL